MLGLCCCLGLQAAPAVAQPPLWPTDASKLLTSSFGEHRERRFHMGLDIKTWARTGYKVFAMQDGWLWRMRVSPYGYGRALYIRTNTGEYHVFAHLERFADHIEALAIREQERNQRYTIEKFFEANAIPVKRGDVIAYSGQTGIGLPHLHVEIRNAANLPVNPILRGLKPDDANPPTPLQIAFTPLDAESRVGGDVRTVLVTPKRTAAGAYTVAQTPRMVGRIGMAVKSYDNNGQYDNKYGVYILRNSVNGVEQYKVQYEQLAFETQHVVELHRDYRLRRRGSGIFEKLYVDPRNTLRIYSGYRPGSGILRAQTRAAGGLGIGRHSYAVELTDGNGNVTTVTGHFEVETPQPVGDLSAGITGLSDAPGTLGISADRYDAFLRLEVRNAAANGAAPTVLMSRLSGAGELLPATAVGNGRYVTVVPYGGEPEFNRTFRAVQQQGTGYNSSAQLPVRLQRVPIAGGHLTAADGNCWVDFPANAAYGDVWADITVEKAPNLPAMQFLGNYYSFEPTDVPFNAGATVTLRYPAEEPHPEKLGIYFKGKRWYYLTGTHNPARHTLTTKVKSLEGFILARDTTPPVVQITAPANGASVTNRRPRISITLRDAMSGISSDSQISVRLDGNIAISAYDPERAVTSFRPRTNLTSGSHTVQVTVTDRVGNVTEKTSTFTITQ
jgi:hypothetical protein